VSNKFYQPGEQRAARVGDLFGVIAPRYDLINDLQSLWLHRHWKKLLINMAAVQPGEKALDICCGTGDIAFALHAAGAEVTGLDFSPAMLAVAEKRASQLPPALPLRFVAGDAMHLPFANATFDVITIGYGLRNLESWERGLEEMARVARPGARLLALDFGKPDNWLWRQLYFCWLRWMVPLCGRIFCHDTAPYAYIYESLKAYPAQHGVAGELRGLGCKDVQVRNLLGGAMSIHFARTSMKEEGRSPFLP
jgi:demethylmenaquinone methyltransferase / 2-methoxy-6-polyprenyl-1,4-benzoquinol methylase